jgi:8-oxo-dGTP diphosphatase
LTKRETHLYQLTKNINSGIKSLEVDKKLHVSVDCVIFGYDETELKVLLMDCDMEDYGNKRSLLGDLVSPNENLQDAVERVILKCTGRSDLYMEEVKVFSDHDRHPLGRVISVAFYALVEVEDFKFEDRNNKHLEWVSMDDANDLAFDHTNILNVCHKRLKKRLRERPLGFRLLPEKFTLRQLQNLYEVVLDIQLDKRNFRRKIKSLNILKDLNEVQQSVSHRPGKLFAFDLSEYENRRSKGFKFEL